MRVVRLVLGLCLAAMVIVLWQQRATMTDAYTAAATPSIIALEGRSLRVTPLAPVAPSVLAVPPAPNTATVTLPVLGHDGPAAPSVPTGPGDVTLHGRVRGPDGPIEGAVVRLERHGIGAVTHLEVVTDAHGAWRYANAVGGRWTARAFVPAELTSGPPVVAFVPAGATRAMDFSLVAAPLAPLVTTVAPANGHLGQTMTVAIAVGMHRVDDGGAVVIDPAPGVSVALDVTTVSAVQLISASQVLTSPQGHALFSFFCHGVGADQITATVSVSDQVVVHPVALADCVDPAPSEPAERDTADGT